MTGLGLVGLGVATKELLPSILAHPEFDVVAVAETRADVRSAFCEDFDVPGYEDVDELCRDPRVDAVYIASPHKHHMTQTVAAAQAGKHILVEKPMALTLEDCDTMIAAAEAHGVTLLVGHTNGFDAPILALRDIAASQRYGSLRMIHTFNYSEFLYRPRRPEELDTSQGGGIMFNQFPHQVEIVRTIAGSQVVGVHANCGVWDRDRPTEGAVMAMLDFVDGVVATVVYNGYGHFNTQMMFTGLDDEARKGGPGTARAGLAGLSGAEEAEARVRSGYLGARGRRGPGIQGSSALYERFGVTIVSFDAADVIPNGSGLAIYADNGAHDEAVVPGRGGEGRSTVFDEFHAAMEGEQVIHDGAWGRSTLAVCLAALESSETGKAVSL